MQILFKRLLIASTVFLFSSAAFAQDVPGGADASRLNRPQELARPDVSPQSEKKATDAYQTQTAPEDYKNVIFKLANVKFEGFSIYAQEELLYEYSSLLGREISLADIHALAEKLTLRYRQDGYIFAKVYLPPQEIDQGIVTLRAIEGQIGLVEIDPSIKMSPVGRKIIKKIRNSKVFNIHDFERQLFLFNDLGSMQVKATFFPLGEEQRESGHVGLKLDFVPSEHYQATVSFDNRGTEYTGPKRLSLQTRVNGTPLQDDRLTLRAQAALPASEMKSVTASYEKTVTAEGLKLGIDAAITRTQPGEELEDLDLASEATTVRLQASYPVIRSRSENLIVGAVMEYNYSKSDVLDEPFYKDNLRIMRLRADWQKADSWLGVTSLRTTVSKGLDFLGGSETGDFNLSRENGRTDFAKIEASISRYQYLAEDWSLFAEAGGQYTSSPLLSAEEFGFGGEYIGRAYDPSEITGDRGAYLGFELSYAGLKSVQSYGEYLPSVYGFYDIGIAENIVEGEDTHESGASAGLGAEWSLFDRTSLKMELAKPLTHDGSSTDDSRNIRFFFSLSQSLTPARGQ